MSPTNLELYEALKKTLDEDAARMLAEVVPTAADVATKADIMNLENATKADIARHEESTRAQLARHEENTRAQLARHEENTRAQLARHEENTKADIATIAEAVAKLAETTKADIARLEVRMGEMEVRLLRRTLSFFLPLWVAVLAALVTVILQA